MPRQFALQRLAVEVRQPARHGERADIDEHADSVRLKRSNQLLKRARGMPDGVDGRQSSNQQQLGNLCGFSDRSTPLELRADSSWLTSDD